MDKPRRFSYEIRFKRVDGEIEYFIHADHAQAQAHYNLFDESDADTYSEIALLEYDHELHKERFIAHKTL